MPTVTVYRNGATLGVGGGNRNPVKRGRVRGWTAAAVRRQTAWLYSIDSDALDGQGYAVTLTMRDTPETSSEFVRLRETWEDRVRRMPGFRRLHWVVEWQRRGTPHLHVAVYFMDPLPDVEAKLIYHWLLAGAGRYGALPQSQHVKPITGSLGWLKYLSKHASRGVAHYQRNGKPAGWETTGRLWGKRGAWPSEPPMRWDLSTAAYWRYRRLVRSWRIADARASGDRQRITYARRMLACSDPRLSAVRGVSDWLPEAVSAAFVVLLTLEGHGVHERVSDDA